MEIARDSKLDFIGIGAAKCATTWAYRCLSEHPQIFMPKKKELHFFNRGKLFGGRKNTEFDHSKPIEENIGEYLEYFSSAPKNSKRGEYSVYYISDKEAAREIKKYFPEIKIVAFLRNPAERAYSLYWFSKQVTLAEESLTFEEALKKHSDDYIEGGKYYKHLREYFSLFPKENMGIFLVDDVKKSPQKVIAELYAFLGVNNKFIPENILNKKNVSGKVRSTRIKRAIDQVGIFSIFLRRLRLKWVIELLRKLGLERVIIWIRDKANRRKTVNPPMKKETREKLKKEFLEDISQLERLIGRDLSAWKK